MKYDPPLKRATFLRRYKRFLADVKLANGEEVTIHCPNTGSMKNCLLEKSPCWYSESSNPKRKYPYTWELATTVSGHLAGINTGLANKLVAEGIANNTITELNQYDECCAEVVYGEEKSRIDFLLRSATKPDCYVEVKSVTLMSSADNMDEPSLGTGLGLFPDSVSSRGSKHLRELMLMKQRGYRAVLLFCVQHMGIEQVSPADEIDPVYGQTLREAVKQGVEVIAYRANLSEHEITLAHPIDVIL